jgi:alcohol dehydrogenase (cytochrome c)
MKYSALVIALFAVAVTSGSAQQPPQGAPARQSRPAPDRANVPFVPVTDEMLWKPSPNDWLSWRRTLDGQAFSPLEQINRNNVSQMRMMWTRAMGTGNQESTPLVYNGVMYIPNARDQILAMDARTGDLLWEFFRQYPQGVNGGTNRNMAIWGTTLIDAGSDNQMYAVDARTGQQVWETFVLDPKKRASASSGPIIANGKVITGRQCQPDAGNDSCIITAHGQGGLAHAHHPAPRRARLRHVG